NVRACEVDESGRSHVLGSANFDLAPIGHDARGRRTVHSYPPSLRRAAHQHDAAVVEGVVAETRADLRDDLAVLRMAFLPGLGATLVLRPHLDVVLVALVEEPQVVRL